MNKKLPYARFLEKVSIIWLLLKTGQLKTIIAATITRIYSSRTSIGLLKNLNEDFDIIESKIQVNIRLFKDADLNLMNEKFRHIGFIKQKIPDCYTGITNHDHPCFRMWFMKSSQNEKIKNYFGDLFPTLNSDEAIIEGVFTNPEYRGLKIMSHTITTICNKHKSEGIDKVIAFVNINNIPSLKGFRRSGFNHYIIRKEKWRFFKRTVVFEPLNKNILEAYEQNTSKNLFSIPIDLEGVFYL
ncbi:MAG: GNAT family N-acetyltransferase [Gelidibacter sp.]